MIKHTYSISRDGIAVLAMPVDMDSLLTTALHGEYAREIAREIEAGVNIKLAEFGVTDDGEWLGEWWPAQIVADALTKFGG